MGLIFEYLSVTILNCCCSEILLPTRPVLSINVEIKVSLIFGFHSLSEFYGSPEIEENISKLVLSTCAIKLNCNKKVTK